MGVDGSDDEKKKKLPASDDTEAVYRVINVLSYFTVLVLIGIPMWWYTTRVYRASLPIDRMFDVEIANKTDKHLGIPLSLEYDVLVTILNPDPENLNVDLNGEDIESNLLPFLRKVSPIADFTVKSQWLYLMELLAMPRRILDHYAIIEDQLPHVITPLEKKLWSHLSPRPCINLVLYVSHCNVPLFIYNKENRKIESNAFLSPRWGGIYIMNPDERSCVAKKFKPDLKLLTSTFVSQLIEILQMDGSDIDSVRALERRKTEDMIDSTRRTLKSLAQLLSEINSIVISDEVADRINVAVEHADLAENYLKLNNVEEALKYAKIAFNNSEAAFSDPSLLALLYFPDDQKYAVYIPLFLPVMIPVLMSLVAVKKWFKNKKAKLD